MAWTRRRPVAAFFVPAYTLSWSWWWAVAAAGGLVRAGVAWPTHMPGLLGPAISAFVVTAALGGRAGVAGPARRMVTVRGGWRTAALTVSPLGMPAVGVLAARAVDGHWPVWADLSAISGLPRATVPMLVGLLVLNGLGEETGWRGLAQERLQQRHGPVRAALLVTAAWGLWHLPLFVILDSFRGFSPATLPGFFLGMAAGALVLAHCYNAAGAGIAAAAVWHVTYNLASAPLAAQGTIAAVSTTLVMVWATWLPAAAWHVHRHHRPSPCGAAATPRPPRPGAVLTPRAPNPGTASPPMPKSVRHRDVAESLGPGRHAGAPDRGRRDVDPERTARPGRPRGLPGRLPEGVEVVRGDLADPESPGPALDGVLGMHLLTTAGDDHATLRTGPEIVELALKAGARRVMLLWNGQVGPVEQAFEGSGLEWTRLQPVDFMGNALGWAEPIRAEGEVHEPFGDVPCAVVDEADVGAVAAAVLVRGGHGAGRTC